MEKQTISQRILDIARRYAVQIQSQPDNDLYLVIGVHCTQDNTGQAFRWDIVGQGMLFEAARRHFDCVLLTLVCACCDATFELTEGLLVCPQCGSPCLSVAERETGFTGYRPGK